MNSAHSPITEGNTAAPGRGRRTLTLTTSACHPHHHPRAKSALSRTFGATSAISCVRIRDFPVQLAAFFIESLQDLPHFVRATSTAQIQVLPVQLQGGAGVLYAVVGFPLNVEVWERQKWKKERDRHVTQPIAPQRRSYNQH